MVGTCPRVRSPCDILGGDERQFPRRKAPTKRTGSSLRLRRPRRSSPIAATRSRADRRLDASAVLVGVVRRSRGRDAGGEAGRQRHRTKRAARGGKAAPSGAVARIFPACGCCHRRSAGRRRRSLGRRTVEGEGVCGLAPGRDAASGGPLAPLGLDHPCERMRRPFLAILRPAPVHQGSLATLHRRRAVASCVSSARQTVWIPFA